MAAAQLFLDRLAFGDVIYDDTTGACAALARRNGCLHPCRERRAVFSRQTQFERLRCACLEQFLALQVVIVRVFTGDKAAERLPDQGAACNPQQIGAGKIRFEDQSVFVQREIAHRRQVVQVEITCARSFQRFLRAAQFVVLQLQFDLMHLQIVKHALRFDGRESVQVFQHPACLVLRNLFRLLAQPFLPAGGRPVLRDRLAHQTPTLSVVATAYICPASLTNAVAVSVTRRIRPSLAMRSIR